MSPRRTILSLKTESVIQGDRSQGCASQIGSFFLDPGLFQPRDPDKVSPERRFSGVIGGTAGSGGEQEVAPPLVFINTDQQLRTKQAKADLNRKESNRRKSFIAWTLL